MKKFILSVLLFFVLVFLCDRMFGIACHYILTHPKDPTMSSDYYVPYATHEDVLVFGSSRANHHYVPGIVEDSLEMSCFNCGKDGTGIVLHYGWLQKIVERYNPKLVIYDISGFDLYPSNDGKCIRSLRVCYDHPGIEEIFHDYDPSECLKMSSMLYRYNTQFITIAGYYLYPFKIGIKGYRPLTGELNPDVEIKAINKAQTDKQVDSLKLKYLKAFSEICRKNDIRLIFAISPRYGADDSDQYQPLYDLCKTYDIPLLNHYTDDRFNRTSYFKDRGHMNKLGAEEYTKELMKEIKALNLSH